MQNCWCRSCWQKWKKFLICIHSSHHLRAQDLIDTDTFRLRNACRIIKIKEWFGSERILKIPLLQTPAKGRNTFTYTRLPKPHPDLTCSFSGRCCQWMCLLGQAVLCVQLSRCPWLCPQPSPDSKPTRDRWLPEPRQDWGGELGAVGSWGSSVWGAQRSAFTLWHSHSSLHTFYACHWWLTASFPFLNHASRVEYSTVVQTIEETQDNFCWKAELQPLILSRPSAFHQSEQTVKRMTVALPKFDAVLVVFCFFAFVICLGFVCFFILFLFKNYF